VAPGAAQAEVAALVKSVGPGIAGGMAWPGLLRRLDREAAGYDA
jgi:hypothetical protein